MQARVSAWQSARQGEQGWLLFGAWPGGKGNQGWLLFGAWPGGKGNKRIEGGQESLARQWGEQA